MKFNHNKIKQLRESKKLTLDDLAFEFRLKGKKIASRSICMWENGKMSPNAKNIGELSEYFKVSPSIFFINK